MNKSAIAWLCIAWAFFLVVGAVGLNVPTVLMIIGSILYLV